MLDLLQRSTAFPLSMQNQILLMREFLEQTVYPFWNSLYWNKSKFRYVKHPLVAEAFNIVGFHLPPGSASRHEVSRVHLLLAEIVQNCAGGREDNARLPRPSPPASLHRTRFEALLEAGDGRGPGEGEQLRSEANPLLQAGTDQQHEPARRSTSGARGRRTLTDKGAV